MLLRRGEVPPTNKIFKLVSEEEGMAGGAGMVDPEGVMLLDLEGAMVDLEATEEVDTMTIAGTVPLAMSEAMIGALTKVRQEHLSKQNHL